MPEVNLTRLEQTFERLNAYTERDSHLDDLFRDLIINSSEDALVRINIYHLAALWKVEPASVLVWMLYASKVGLFDLHWETHCPHCTGVNRITTRLGAISHEGQCKLCQTEYVVHSDENIEVTFSINRAICSTARTTLKSFLTPHEYFLGTFDATQSIELTLEKPGKYFLAPPQGAGGLGAVYRVDVDDSYPALSEVRVNFYPELVTPARSHAAPGKLTVHAEGVQQVVGLYRDDNQLLPEIEKVTGLKVMLMPEFKQIFASESLSQRESLSVKNLTLMFTDITGSTAMYQRLGDIRAYNLVRDHFEVLFREINKHEGVVVKTIGDAVMAAFSSADDALRAALEVQASIRAFNAGRDVEEGTILVKIGLHSGSAIAVNLNNTLDYFGNMVNMAARIQGKSRSEEILMSEVVYDDPQVRKILTSNAHLIIRDGLYELHGIGEQHLYSLLSQII